MERLRHGGDEATPVDAVVDLLTPERPVHALPRVKHEYERGVCKDGGKKHEV